MIDLELPKLPKREKIPYCPSLYIEMANYEIDKWIKTKNRKGWVKNIHVTNIVQLSWEDIQSIGAYSDKFTSMVIMYEKFKDPSITTQEILEKYLNTEEEDYI